MERIVLGDDPDVKGGVYVLRIGRWFYFGKARNFGQRRSGHFSKLRKKLHDNCILQRAFDKCGEGGASFEPVVWCGSNDAARIEAELIQSCRDIPTCANIRLEDGETYTHSKQTRRKIGDSHRGRTHSESARQKMSAAQKKRFEHTPVSDETRKKLARNWRGRKHTKETLAKMSESAKRRHVERPFTPEVRKRMAEHAKAGVAKAMVSVKKPVLVVMPNFESIYFLSGVDAERSLGFPKGKLGGWIRGDRPVPKRLAGYRFSYLDKTRENWSAFPTACTHEHYEISGK